MAYKKIFKLPPAPSNKMWALTEREKVFLDLTLFLTIPYAEIYRMAINKDITETAAKTKASALATSMDGKDYIDVRSKQLEEFFYPSDQAENEDGKTTETKLRTLEGKVVRMLEGMLDDPTNEAHFDAIKLVMQKVSKDLESGDGEEPPKRYLPVRCGECAYKNWIHSNCEIKCHQCKYREFGIKNGLQLEFEEMFNKEEQQQ